MRKIVELNFHFHNGGEWKIPVSHVGDIWIRRIAKSIGRINGGDIVEIYPAQALKLELLPEADTFETTDINQGSLETGMFETIARNDDVEWLTINWDNNEKENIWFPYEPETEDGIGNIHMSTKIGENGHLYIVIDPNHTVDDFYPEV